MVVLRLVSKGINRISSLFRQAFMNEKTRKTIFGWQGMALFIALIAIFMWLLTLLNPDMGDSGFLNERGGDKQLTACRVA